MLWTNRNFDFESQLHIVQERVDWKLCQSKHVDMLDILQAKYPASCSQYTRLVVFIHVLFFKLFLCKTCFLMHM